MPPQNVNPDDIARIADRVLKLKGQKPGLFGRLFGGFNIALLVQVILAILKLFNIVIPGPVQSAPPDPDVIKAVGEFERGVL
jgi:hypothetical protein